MFVSRRVSGDQPKIARLRRTEWYFPCIVRLDRVYEAFCIRRCYPRRLLARRTGPNRQSKTLIRPARTVQRERAGPVGFTGRDLEENPHFLERGFLLEMDHVAMGPMRLPGPPMRLGHDPLDIWRLGPLMGEDNDYVLGSILGRSTEDIARLQEEGVVA